MPSVSGRLLLSLLTWDQFVRYTKRRTCNWDSTVIPLARSNVSVLKQGIKVVSPRNFVGFFVLPFESWDLCLGMGFGSHQDRRQMWLRCEVVSHLLVLCCGSMSKLLLYYFFML